MFKMFKLKKREILLIIIIFFIIYFICKGRKSDNDEFDEEMNRSIEGLVAMNDPWLINEIKYKFLIPPVDQTLHPLSLDNPNVDYLNISQRGEAKIIMNYLDDKKDGFFIEVGAFDGETISNTLYFEVNNNWTGLLIEADPFNFSKLKKKNRRAWISNTCVSINRYPEMVDFESRTEWGRIYQGVKNQTSIIIKVKCIPLYSYLLALNITHVDYFSLDVEGYEFQILKTIPFQLINIQTISIETQLIDVGVKPVVDFMTSQGYEVYEELPCDIIFVKKKNGIV